MNVLKDAPLRRKLMSIAMLCSFVALSTTAVALGVYEWLFYRKNIFAQLTTITAIAASNRP